MIEFQNIRALHLEFSSRCNARCPLCPRNLNGFPYNRGYKETDLDFNLVKRRITPNIISNLRQILVNGNFGDFVMNMKSLDILRYLRSNNSNVLIIISTNGGARDKSFWQALAQTDINAKIEFCLDGLEDTHHLYRQDTTFSKVLENACNFISSGGKAIWKMVKFDHNLHQIDACEKLSKELGFHQFNLIDHGRNHGVALNRDGTRSHVLGLDKWPLSISAQDLILQEQNDTMKAILTKKEYDTNSKLTCFSRSSKSIYISAKGKVYPCCWLGFSPDTYNQGGTGLYNNQIAPLISKNDLNEYDLETCMQWFIEIEKSWSKNSYEDGRLMRCDASCGTCTNK